MLTIDRLKQMQTARRDQYYTLTLEAGRADASQIELPVAELDQLDALATALGFTAEQVGEDLAAARGWINRQAQLAEAEAAAPSAKKDITRLQEQLASRLGAKNELAQRRTYRNADETDRELREVRADITTLSAAVRDARRPMARTESAKRVCNKLLAARPWLEEACE